jgi:hypothetical protein
VLAQTSRLGDSCGDAIATFGRSQSLVGPTDARASRPLQASVAVDAQLRFVTLSAAVRVPKTCPQIPVGPRNSRAASVAARDGAGGVNSGSFERVASPDAYSTSAA